MVMQALHAFSSHVNGVTEGAASFPCSCSLSSHLMSMVCVPQWGAGDAEIKVPSDENTELEGFPFKAWSRSVYSHACDTFCQGLLPYLFLPFWSIQLHFFPKPLPIFPVLDVASAWFLCRPAE